MKTGYTANYTLNIELENCEIIEIDFPNGGYLNDDHIVPAELDEYGNAIAEDGRGRTFNVHINKPYKIDRDNSGN